MSFEHYEKILGAASNLDAIAPVPTADIAKYEGILPPGLLEVWRRHGNKIVFGDGRVQLCDPGVFQPIVTDWLRGDPEFDPEKIVVYAYTSDGTLLFTDGTLQNYSIATALSQFTADRFNPPPSGETDTDFFLAHVLTVSNDYMPSIASDVDEHALAVEREGPIGVEEVFGWVPPFQLSANENNRMKKFDAPVHFSFIQELGPLEYHRYDTAYVQEKLGETFVRYIGQQE